MTTVFQPNVFQHGVFQIIADSGTVLMPGKSGPSGSSFSRKRFEEIRAAQRAVEAAGRKALELKTKQAEALKKAAVAVEQVAREVEEHESTADLERLTEMLVAATNATRATSVLKNAKAAYEHAMASLEWEDEEEVEMLLLH